MNWQAQTKNTTPTSLLVHFYPLTPVSLFKKTNKKTLMAVSVRDYYKSHYP